MIDLKMKFPPSKEYLNVPSEFVNRGDILGSKVMAVCCNPILFALYTISDKANGFLRLINIRCSKQDNRIVEDYTARF